MVAKAVQHYMKTWPSDFKQVAFKDLQLHLLPVSLRRYLKYSFYNISMSVMLSEGELPEFTKDGLSRKVHDLVDRLYDQWVITSSSFQKMLQDGVGFNLSLAIDPARAISGLAEPSTGGNPTLLRFLIRALIDHEQLHQRFQQLISEISGREDHMLHPMRIEFLARGILCRLSVSEALASVRNGMKRIFEYAGVMSETQPKLLNLKILSTMLEARGLSELADGLRFEEKLGKNAMTIGQLDMMVERYKYYTNQMVQ